MDQNWFNLPLLRRNWIKYISENFYPAKYMTAVMGFSLRYRPVIKVKSDNCCI